MGLIKMGLMAVDNNTAFLGYPLHRGGIWKMAAARWRELQNTLSEQGQRRLDGLRMRPEREYVQLIRGAKHKAHSAGYKFENAPVRDKDKPFDQKDVDAYNAKDKKFLASFYAKGEPITRIRGEHGSYREKSTVLRPQDLTDKLVYYTARDVLPDKTIYIPPFRGASLEDKYYYALALMHEATEAVNAERALQRGKMTIYSPTKDRVGAEPLHGSHVSPAVLSDETRVINRLHNPEKAVRAIDTRVESDESRILGYNAGLGDDPYAIYRKPTGNKLYKKMRRYSDISEPDKNVETLPGLKKYKHNKRIDKMKKQI